MSFDAQDHARRFFAWLDKVETNAAATDVGKLMKAAGFEIAHTGGGCLAWEKQLGTSFLWVCDEGNGLGDVLDELYLVGHYTPDAEIIADGDVPNLQAAIEWCAQRTPGRIIED